MSETLNEVILSVKQPFTEMDIANGRLLDFKQECMFARQQVMKNDMTTTVAANNPGSLKSAILNVAAIGISLNPALQHAYLVPRDGKICLDISYRGLVKLATDCGAIKWAKTELVYQNDEFEWQGVNKEPVHKANPFGDRGAVIGGYCIAKLPDDSVMVETMTLVEMEKIRATSKAANGPWKTWPDEMRKKSVTKRASKSWPQTGNRVRVDKAIEVLNEHEGIEEAPPEVHFSQDEYNEYKRCIEESDFVSLFSLSRSLGVEAQLQLYNACVPKAEHGMKGKKKKEFQDNMAEGGNELEAAIAILRERLDECDDAGVQEIVAEFSPWSLAYAEKQLSAEHVSILNKLREAA